MTSTNRKNLKAQEAAIEEELERRKMTTTERQLFAARGIRPARFDEPAGSATERQVAAALGENARRNRDDD